MLLMKKPIVLVILDGFGLSNKTYGNAIKQAKTINYDYLWRNYPHSKLEASGVNVGLPEGQMGNSEVGHMNIGAGRVVYQPLEVISNDIKTGALKKNHEFNELFKHVKKNKSRLHIMGLLSDGGVHSHIDHLIEILKICKEQQIEEVYIHGFLDGRDTSPMSALKYLDQLDSMMGGYGKLATLCGRFYAMDRDNRWDRIKFAYDNIVYGKGIKCTSYQKAIENSYIDGNLDEFIEPINLCKEGTIKDSDGILIFNYRPDRLRELLMAISNPEFKEFKTKKFNNIKITTMFPVSEDVKSTSAYELVEMKNTLGEFLNERGYRQLRIAETEKYAHVTYFFDGGYEKDFEGMEKILIPSPKVDTYDKKPEMSATKITNTLLKRIEDFDVVILNFANGDMVGHTGNIKAAIKAVGIVDYNLGRIHEKVKKLGGTLIVTADHGNCEEMLDKDGNILTAHTTNLVPFIITDKHLKLNDGRLCDIAPTIVELLDEKKPKYMTGISLIKK